MAHGGVQPPPPPSISIPASEERRTPSIQLTQSPLSDARLEDYYVPTFEEREGGDDDNEEERSSSDTGLLASHSHVDSDTTDSTSLGSPKDADQHDHSLRGGGGRKGRSWWKDPSSRLPTLPTLYRNILKCSLAYFLGSLFTYYSPLSRFISELTQDGPGEKYPSAMGHMVATVAVYYNPAKTLGGMIEADIYCLMGLAFASFISLGSMYTYWALEPHAGWEWLADALVLIWIGVGMSMVAWFKLWIAKPTFNPGTETQNFVGFPGC